MYEYCQTSLGKNSVRVTQRLTEKADVLRDYTESYSRHVLFSTGGSDVGLPDTTVLQYSLTVLDRITVLLATGTGED